MALGDRLLQRRFVDGASLRAFRLMFGLLAAGAAVRFVLMDWVSALYLEPAYHFAWVPWAVVPSAGVLYALFAAQVIGGLGTAFAREHRPWLLLWLLSFGYVELLDKALYLNHYVLMTLLGLTLLAHRPRRDGRASERLLWLLRLEVGLVYFWAGVCKVNADWLLRGEPLSTWLSARAEVPLIGPLLDLPATGLLMSWGGCAYDLGIAALLLWPRARPAAIALVVFFHTLLGLLFPIGVFPVLMLVAVTLFFPYNWPRRLTKTSSPTALPGERAAMSGLVGLFAAVLLVLFPARFVLYGGDVNWDEQGYRFSWRVLLTEKTGFVEYTVRTPERDILVRPRHELTEVQHNQLVGKPDLIAQFGRHLSQRYGGAPVFADSVVSLNGHPSSVLVRPEVDLSVPASQLPAGWIAPRSSAALADE